VGFLRVVSYNAGMTLRDELLATVASLYYKLNQNQSQIATRLDMSASKVSRMLKEAHERGIVEIHIHLPIPRDFALEQELIDTFGIKDAYVLQTTDSSEHPVLIRSLGRLAATYVELIVSELPDGQSIGASWSESVYATFDALPEKLARNISVVQLAGGVSAYGFDYTNLSQSVAAKLGGRHYLLHAPCAVERPDMRDMLLQEPMIRDVITRAGQVALAICGIGAMSEDNSFVRSGLLAWEELQALRVQGIVGEMCGTFYDLDGYYAHYDINQRTIGVQLATLRTLPRVLAVARGVSKAVAIAGALRGGFVKVLATDDLTARAVLGIGK
jgi:DNA-binding transcriptional regulator LsrR (DeoR family)